MAKTAKKSPGVGHNSGSTPPSAEDVNYHLAVMVLDQEEKDKLNERIKSHSKAAQGARIQAEDLKELFKMKDLNAAEIELYFRRKWNVFSAYFSDLGKQFQLFAPKPGAPETRAAFRHSGLMAGLKGADDAAPPNLTADENNQWQEGYDEGFKSREKARVDRLEEIRKALENAEAGKVTDGTGKGDQASQVRAQAAADFERDNPSGGHKADLGEDEFEASAEELAQQQGRPQPEQEAEDPAAVEKKLQEEAAKFKGGSAKGGTIQPRGRKAKVSA